MERRASFFIKKKGGFFKRRTGRAKGKSRPAINASTEKGPGVAVGGKETEIKSLRVEAIFQFKKGIKKYRGAEGASERIFACALVKKKRKDSWTNSDPDLIQR